jgi:hypothetical protein
MYHIVLHFKNKNIYTKIRDTMIDLSIISNEALQESYRIISNNVKKQRILHKKSQLDIVLEMGIRSTSFYSKCENAKENHHFNIEHLLKIAKILDVEIGVFFEGLE